MYDDPGFLTLSAICAITVVAVFAALLRAAVLDGRDEQAFRAKHYE